VVLETPVVESVVAPVVEPVVEESPKTPVYTEWERSTSRDHLPPPEIRIDLSPEPIEEEPERPLRFTPTKRNADDWICEKCDEVNGVARKACQQCL
jgi:hypothetical protein